MAMLPPQEGIGGGYYDANGDWIRTKFCLVYCGASCNCMPPNMRQQTQESPKELPGVKFPLTGDSE